MNSYLSHPSFLINGPTYPKKTIVLAHGAGSPMDSKFMEFFATSLAEQGYRIVRFEFPYMAARRAVGKKRPPNDETTLENSWRNVILELGTKNLIIGGKSMGGRIASHIADEVGAQGLICLGFPFYPAGKKVDRRINKVRSISTPTLICQGTRDLLGKKNNISKQQFNSSIHFHWLQDGDHDFRPRKKSGLTMQNNWDNAVSAISNFIQKKALKAKKNNAI